MLHDLASIKQDDVLDFGICVIGAGAAGITFCRELDNSGDSIALLEAGGLDYTNESQDSYRGETYIKYGDRVDARPGYLFSSRLRFFGGTTGHWEGFCHPLEQVDFRYRSWVPYSGWPIPYSEYTGYLQRARKILQIPSSGAGDTPANDTVHGPFGGPDVFNTKTYHTSPPTRFGRVYGRDIAESANVRYFGDSPVVHLQASEDGTRIERVRAVHNGTEFYIQAGKFILAMGGIENPRLLLHSDDVHKTGLGNRHDVVGRFFMEHAEYYNSAFWLLNRNLDLSRFDWSIKNRTYNPDYFAIGFTEAVQEKYKQLNMSLQIKNLDTDVLDQEQRGFYAFFPEINNNLEDANLKEIVTRIEMVPDPDNRIRLADQTDSLGVRRCVLTINLSDLALSSVRSSARIIALELGKSENGRVLENLGHEDFAQRFIPGSHHMGTTRMGTDPGESVVDPDCRVHGISNLYIAGSSVFPTSGFATPTFTIVALTLRLADHIKSLQS